MALHSASPAPAPLTDASSSQQAASSIGGEAAREDGLHHVVGKGDGDDGLAGRLNDEERGPESDEGKQSPKGLEDVGIAGPRLLNGGAQFRITKGPEDREEASNGPDDQGEAKGGTVHENTLGGHKDAGANHVPHNQAHAIQQRYLLLQLHLLGPWAGLLCQRGGLSHVLGGHFVLNTVNHGGGGKGRLHQLPGIAL